jgi:hypothetical protein
MSDFGFAISAMDSVTDVRGGERIGPVQVLECRQNLVELRVPGELGVGRTLLGLVPIVWCAAAWTLALREHVLEQRLRECLVLSLMAAISAFLMVSSLGILWRFDGRRRRITRRVGLFARSINARRLAGLRIESTAPSPLTEVMLRMTLVDATGAERFEIAAWNRCEIDRGDVEALAAAIRRTMKWTEES